MTQVYYEYSNPGAMWRRWGDGVGTWSPWFRMIDSSNVANYAPPFYTTTVNRDNLTTHMEGYYIYYLPTIAVNTYTKIYIKVFNNKPSGFLKFNIRAPANVYIGDLRLKLCIYSR